MDASQGYAASYIDALERSVAFFADYAETSDWPPVSELGLTHIEDYLVHFANRERWIGQMVPDAAKVSRSYVETQYRRLKRFFGWLKQRGYVKSHPPGRNPPCKGR